MIENSQIVEMFPPRQHGTIEAFIEDFTEFANAGTHLLQRLVKLLAGFDPKTELRGETLDRL